MKLVILDRDGVINEDSDDYIKSADEWIPLPGSIAAIARLTQAGYGVVIATNQSGIGRGYFQPQDLQVMHRKLVELVEKQGGSIAGIYFCPHRPEDCCDCRKPAPGLMDAIIADFNLNDLDGIAVVGDSLRDLEAGLARKGTPILVRTGKGMATEAQLRHQPSSPLASTLVFDNLSAVANYLTEHL
ncbi:MAG: D-glycero-beta-D-manno-heptose 1,7-bisphosphate 7-phosphatase [Porticoccaceae bacterium]